MRGRGISKKTKNQCWMAKAGIRNLGSEILAFLGAEAGKINLLKQLPGAWIQSRAFLEGARAGKTPQKPLSGAWPF